MANVKISELPVATSLNGADSFPVVQGGVTKQAARSVLFASPTFTGTTTADILTATGDVSFDGGAFVFNESGADKDARFEGDTDANLLFLDASTDRVGIGTATPAAKLDVAGDNGTGYVRLTATDVTLTGKVQARSATGSIEIGSVTNSPLVFVTNDTERMILDASGNLGLGVTPSAWNTSAKAIQFNTRSAIFAFSDDTHVAQNAYYDSVGYKYIATLGAASNYRQAAGQHQWYTAPSGTAGNAISFTQAATLDANGNFIVGTTSTTYRLHSAVSSGADRDIFLAGVNAVTNGLTVQWNHATSKIHVRIADIPTSAAGLPAGTLWSDGGTLKIA